MRTTITLDPDVASLLKKRMTRRGTSLKETVNEALREGLRAVDAPREARTAYRTEPWRLGGSLMGSLDNVEEVLSRAEGERHK